LIGTRQSAEERRARAARAAARREAWKEQQAANADIDWARFGKYDMLQQLLQAAAAEPEAQV
jgi:hypothetical protein